MPELHLVAGPNGSGKSSFVRNVRNERISLDYTIPRIVNTDTISFGINALDPGSVGTRTRLIG